MVDWSGNPIGDKLSLKAICQAISGITAKFSS